MVIGGSGLIVGTTNMWSFAENTLFNTFFQLLCMVIFTMAVYLHTPLVMLLTTEKKILLRIFSYKDISFWRRLLRSLLNQLAQSHTKATETCALYLHDDPLPSMTMEEIQGGVNLVLLLLSITKS